MAAVSASCGSRPRAQPRLDGHRNVAEPFPNRLASTRPATNKPRTESLDEFQAASPRRGVPRITTGRFHQGSMLTSALRALGIGCQPP